MKILYKLSASYAILGIIGGVFFREFTKFQGYEDTTSLGFVHTHAFMLGMFFFLIVLILEKLFAITHARHYEKFLGFYNAGVLISIVMLVVRGIPQVLQATLSSGIDGAISGISGIGHILICIGLIYFYLSLKQQIKNY